LIKVNGGNVWLGPVGRFASPSRKYWVDWNIEFVGPHKPQSAWVDPRPA